jgi:hypothetical protein
MRNSAFVTEFRCLHEYETPQAITDASGNLEAAYVFAGEHPIAKITPTGIEYYLQDSMGSVIGAYPLALPRPDVIAPARRHFVDETHGGDRFEATGGVGAGRWRAGAAAG